MEHIQKSTCLHNSHRRSASSDRHIGSVTTVPCAIGAAAVDSECESASEPESDYESDHDSESESESESDHESESGSESESESVSYYKSDYDSAYEPQSNAAHYSKAYDSEAYDSEAFDSETGSNAESDAVSSHMRPPLASCSAPAAVNMALMVEPEADHHLGVGQVWRHQQQSNGEQSRVLHSSDEQSASVASRAVVTTAVGEEGAAVANPPDKRSSGKFKPVQQLKNLLSAKLCPSHVRAADKGTSPHKQLPTVLEENSSKGQQASEHVRLRTIPADRSTAKEQQQQQQQQPMPFMAGGNKQRLSKVRSFFRFKKGASKQVVSAGGRSLAPQSVQEAAPADLTAAGRKPSGVAQQADHDPTTVITTAAAKPAHRVSSAALLIVCCKSC